jgi:hypothetical protein
MAAETQYTANTGMVTISTANSNLDGTGTLSSAIITGDSNGTFLKTVSIKAQGDTSHGMIRLFVSRDGKAKLLKEVVIPSVIKATTDAAFECIIPMNFELKSGDILKASTQNAESFNIIAEGLDWVYYATSVRSEITEYVVKNGLADLSTANSNLDGTGTIETVITASGNGYDLKSVTVKAIVSTSAGMVRLFLYDGSNTKLFREVPIAATTKSSIARAFASKITFNDGFALKTGWSLKASTENAESFKVIVDALNWSYPA